MRRIKKMVALMMAVMVLVSISGSAEEPTGAQIPITPANQDTPLDVLIPDTGTSVAEDGNDGTTTLEFGALELDTTNADLDYSQRLTIHATTFPSGETLLWSSSDETVAMLSAESGRSVDVVAVKEGTATITCTAGSASQTCTVTVNAPKTLQITGVDYPATYSINRRGWKIRNGTVASTVDLASLTSVIKNVDGVEVASTYTHTFNEGTRRFDIRGIDNYVPFSRITEVGVFTWTLTATDIGGRTVLVDMPINAVSGAETSVSTEAGKYSAEVTLANSDSQSSTTNGENLFAMSTSTAGYLNDANDGTINHFNDYGETTSDYIPVSPGEVLTIQTWATSTAPTDTLLHYMIDWMWFSDKDSSAHIGTKTRFRGGSLGFNHAAVTTDVAPMEAKYIRVDARLYDDGKIKVERGSASTEWSAASIDMLELQGNSDVLIDETQKTQEGQNLFVMNTSVPGYLSDLQDGTIDHRNWNGEVSSEYIPVLPGEVYTIQTWATSTDAPESVLHYMIDWMWFSDKDSSEHIGNKTRYKGGCQGFNHAVVTTEVAPDEARYIRIDARLYVDGKIKVERGSKATEWMPAPEDITVEK